MIASADGATAIPSLTAVGDGSHTADSMKGLKSRQHEMLLQGREVIDLSMVNPDLPPPRPVLDRLLEYVTKTSTHRYAVSRGVRRLREAFAEKYQSFGVSLDPERNICVCLGSKDATYHALRALVKAGESVIVSAPAYPAHLSAIRLVGAVPYLWEAPDSVEGAATSLGSLLEKTKASLVLLNFPSNPTGRVVSAEWLKGIAAEARKHSAYIVNDFVYGEMCFSGEKAPSLLAATPDNLSGVLEVYSLSKAYNVPGWRVGALSGDEEVVKEVARQKSIADYGVFLPLQYAAALALTAKEDLVRSTVTQYERRSRILVKGLKGMGWSVVEPEAGASVWAEIPADISEKAMKSYPSTHLSESHSVSIRVARLLLEEAGVLSTPGAVFGDSFDTYLRFALVVPEERMRDVLEALNNLSS
jgi:alanine-synthesizing transaminase